MTSPAVLFNENPIVYSWYVPSSYSVIYSAVPPTNEDSIPLHLVQKTQVMNVGVTPYPYVYPWQPYDYYWPQVYPGWTFWTLVYPVPVCGDSFHENGQLSSQIECVDSVAHGKAIFWDETGHKTSESTYSEGHQIKQKVYDSRGRMTGMYHYDYQNSLHGICVYYNYNDEYNSKTVEHYEHGQLHGIREEYSNGILIKQEIYSEGSQISLKQFNESGQITFEEKKMDGNVVESIRYNDAGIKTAHDKSNDYGQLEFSRQWNDQGVLIVEKLYGAGTPIGKWLVYHNPEQNNQQFEYYEKGVKVRFENRIGERLRTEIDYNNGLEIKYVEYSEDSDTLEYEFIASDGVSGYQKKWDQNGVLLRDTKTLRDTIHGELLTGTGFFINFDTLYFYEAEQMPWNKILARTVIFQGDTIRQDYCENFSDPYARGLIYAMNHFAFNSTTNSWERQGIWKTYDDNNLVSVVTYKNGVKDGRVVYYESISDSVFVTVSGFYKNNLKTGEWTNSTDDGQHHLYTYQDDVKNGIYQCTNPNGSLVCIANYENDLLQGEYTEFYLYGSVKAKGQYLNGQKTGWWIYYNERGEIIKEGAYENDEPIKKWFEYTPDKNGEMERTKVVYS